MSLFGGKVWLDVDVYESHIFNQPFMFLKDLFLCGKMF